MGSLRANVNKQSTTIMDACQECTVNIPKNIPRLPQSQGLTFGPARPVIWVMGRQ